MGTFPPSQVDFRVDGEYGVLLLRRGNFPSEFMIIDVGLTAW